jgi:hypothetical protein
MDMRIANSWWMYLLGALVTVFVLVGCLFFIVRAYKDAIKIGMDKKIVKKVIFNSAIFTILPSISILIGVVALSGNLGVPLPWIRLSVIGALHYEGAAAQAALDALGTEVITKEAFVTIAFVMTLGILSGPLYCLFGFKAYDKKVLAKTRVEEEVKAEVSEAQDKPKKRDFGSILFNAVFIAMVGSFLSVDIVKVFKTGQIGELDNKGNVIEPIDTFIPIIVIVVTFGCMALCDFLEKKCKQKWLSSFGLGLSMLVGMASAVLVNFLYNLG